MNAGERFARIGRWLDEDQAERIARDARLDPGTKLLAALRWSQAWLDDYRRFLRDPANAAREDERAWTKSDLHALWRRRHET